jgi:hypothetical protein
VPQVELPEYWLHPKGVFPLQLLKVEDATGQWGAQIKWTWETPEMQTHEDGSPRLDDDGRQMQGRIGDFTGCSASAKSKLGKLLVALGVGLPTTKDEAAAMNDAWFQRLRGKRVNAEIVHTLRDDGRILANIERYAPIGGKTVIVEAPRVGPEGDDCPDPSYDHSLKPGKEGHDPFHQCSRMQKKAA